MVPNKEADGHSSWAHLQRVLYDIILLGLTRNNPNSGYHPKVKAKVKLPAVCPARLTYY